MNEPLFVLRPKALNDWHREKLIEDGFEEIEPDVLVKVDGNTRVKMERVDGGWAATVDMLVGVRVLDQSVDPLRRYIEYDGEMYLVVTVPPEAMWNA